VLERLAASGLVNQGDTVLDYGCGKGRVDFFLAFRTKAYAIGIEYDGRIWQSAQENQKSAVARAKAEFLLTRAEAYEVPEEVNRCYFFNPFTVEILHKVMARILESYYEHPREIYLFFYYPDQDYIAYLMTVQELEFFDEIECEDLFPGNDLRERILIFQLPGYETEEQA
jgi:predicted RNA methylase